MKYLKQEGDKIIKYHVDFNKKELNEIRYTIIKKCGKREHKSYDSDYPQKNWLFHENYKETIIGRTDYFEEMRRIYHVEYDLIHEPQLSKLIDNFINKNDLLLLDYIFGDKKLLSLYDEQKSKIEERKALIIKLKEMLDTKIDKIDYDEAKNILDQIKLVNKENNSNFIELEDQTEYIDLVKNAITLNKIDEINSKIYGKVIKFTKKFKR